ncbi:hypothetical protein G8759_29410 [Spirosoma aureum]|uniref:DUF4332 domain-containing protein n=1 Tax=Spirosoma aureum TaxID=2692134 RepID=A0A6G9AVH2_9BACT|nr:hypothetical protein [Spirosoma aureum]QIP16472.1 hypothetical protein G8759_29410 [Spirosoma aureum]
MFGLDPLSRPVAVIEILLLLAFIAFVGWLLGRLALSGRISSLRTAIADQEAELEECRRSKAAGGVPGTIARTANTPKAPPAFVHADPLLPAIAPDDTPELIDAEPELPAVAPVADVQPVMPPAPPVIPTPGLPATGNSEAAVLSRIAARSGELNFDRIGRAVALEADDLKDIVGIGPFLERKLHSLGIYTFRQIANFTKEDIDKVNEIIEFFPGRIERDNWVEQSKSFYERKYGSKN